MAAPKPPHAKPRRSVLFHPRVFIASAPGQCHKKGGCLPAFFNQPVQHGRFSIGNRCITRQAGIRQAKHALPVLQHFVEGVEKRLPQQIGRPRIGARKFAGQRAQHGVQRGLKVMLPCWTRRQQRGQLLPAAEIAEVTAAANVSAAALAGTAGEVVAMERAAGSVPQSRAHLAPTIQAYTAQLDAGVRQYSDIATAAAQLVSAANSGAGSARSMSEQRYRSELVAATDRFAG